MHSADDDDDTKEPAIDPERDETLNILSDLVNLERGAEDREHDETLNVARLRRLRH